MPAAARQIQTRELVIRTPDGKVRRVPLNQDSFSLGRAGTNSLCYAEDTGLSRQHLVLERTGENWSVKDCGSKNGTYVNGARISGTQELGIRDRITAGHLTLEVAEDEAPIDHTVVFIEGSQQQGNNTTVVTKLEGLLDKNRADGKAILEGGPQMQALIRAGRELAGHRPLNELFQLIMDLSIDAVGAARGVLMSLENDELVVRAAKGEGFRISKSVRDRVIKEKTSLLVRDARLDQAFAAQASIVEQQIRSIVAVPLQTDNRVIGLIYLDSPHFVREFTKEDLNLLTVMANVAAIRIEHARLAEVEQAERMLASELQQAAQIQRKLLPEQAPAVEGLELAGFNAACRGVGGDYYDFLPYGDGRVGVLVGDVSGKGMAAALMMSSLQARVQVIFEDSVDLASLMTKLNRVVTSNCPSGKFITFFFAVIDSRKGEMTYCNAGHNPPLLARANGKVETLDGTGLILGIMAGAKYEQRTVKMNVGDVVLLFSDGVTEACPADRDEEFGEKQLGELVAAHRTESAPELIQSINAAVKTWTAGAPPADDVTLLVARRVASS